MEIDFTGVAELAKAGFLAVAATALILSYRLLKGLTASKDYKGDDLKIRFRLIQMFMIGTLIVLIMGMIDSFIDPKITVKFDVSPKDTQGLVVKVGGDEINITNNDDIYVRDSAEISLDLVKLDRVLRDLSKRVNYNKDVAEGVKEALDMIKKQQVKEDLKSISSKEEGI